jgi:hypothetical protein
MLMQIERKIGGFVMADAIAAQPLETPVPQRHAGKRDAFGKNPAALAGRKSVADGSLAAAAKFQTSQEGDREEMLVSLRLRTFPFIKLLSRTAGTAFEAMCEQKDHPGSGYFPRIHFLARIQSGPRVFLDPRSKRLTIQIACAPNRRHCLFDFASRQYSAPTS